jgi:hypothetical protein
MQPWSRQWRTRTSRLEDTDGLVVTGETVDSGLDEDETELGVLVLSVALKMLADSDGLYPLISINPESWVAY